MFLLKIFGKLKDRTVLVAGGAGFIGSQLVRELIGVGSQVVVYDNFLHGTKSNLEEIEDKIDLVIGDVLDEWTLIDTFMKYKPDFVFNCVGDTYVPTAYTIPKRFFRINVEGNLNILMACKKFNVKRILYVSSTEVYGEAQIVPQNEEHIFNPLNTYAVSKLASDRLCYTTWLEHGIPVIIARIYNSYGYRETEPYIVPEIITQLSKGNVVRLGNVNAMRDFTFVSDTCKGLMATLCSDIPNGEAVNIGSGNVYSVKQLVEIIAKLMNKDAYIIEIEQSRLRKKDIEIFKCDYSKLHKATGWKPTIDIETGLKMTIDWFNMHGKRWSWEQWVNGTTTYKV